MRYRRNIPRILLMFCLPLVLGGAGKAGAVQENAAEPEVQARAVELDLLDLPLLDQDGRTVKFRTGAIGDRIAVIDVFYSTCGLVCPVLTAILADVQDRVGDRLGKEVVLISVTVDPVTDVPKRLKAFSKRYDAREGWLFLTGSRQNVDRVLQGIDAYTADFTAHPAMVLVGDGRGGGWTRFYGFPSPEQVTGTVERMLAARGAAR